MNFYKHFIGDYQRKTGTLSMVEHGAYRLMLDAFYATQEPLPLDRKELHRLLRAEGAADRAAIDKILAKFWTETEAGYVNPRAQEEIDQANHLASISRSVGKLGGRPKGTQRKPTGLLMGSENETQDVTQNNPSHSHSQIPEKTRSKDLATQPDGFAEFWQAYTRKVKKPSAEKAWRKLGRVNGILPTILHAVEEQAREGGPLHRSKGEYIPHPATWINNHSWEDAAIAAPVTDYAQMARDLGMEEA